MRLKLEKSESEIKERKWDKRERREKMRLKREKRVSEIKARKERKWDKT